MRLNKTVYHLWHYNVTNGWPKYIKDVERVQRYWEGQDKISQVNDIFTYGDRITTENATENAT